MTAGYLLDTNVLSEPLRPEPSTTVLDAMRQHEGTLTTAAPVWHELHFGCARLPKSRRRAVIEEYLQDVVERSIVILPYDAACARWHAEERARLVAAGKTPSFVDGQIAAVAKLNDLTLVTDNLTDFRVFDGLSVESWR